MGMKTSYELAMERFGGGKAPAKLSAEQKEDLARLDAVYKAKIAEREIALQGDLAQAEEKGDAEEMEKAQQRLLQERRKLQAELEEKKESVRQGKR